MDEALTSFFSLDYMPHGHCYLWQPGILWTHVISDLAIGLAYFSIPVMLVLVVRKRPDLRYHRLVYLFAAFILCCGLTHLFSIYTIWNGAYGVYGLAKLVTAVVSVFTVVELSRLVPQLLSLPTPAEHREALNQAADEKLKRSRLELERKAEAIFQFTTELVPTGLLVIDAERNIRLANADLEMTFGYLRHELIGQPLSLLIEGPTTDYHDALVQEYLRNPTQDHAMASGRIVKGKRKDGGPVSIEISLSVHEFEGEKHAFATVVDISRVTSRKSSNLESNNRIKRAVEAINDGIWEWNVQTNEVWYSPRLMGMIGHDPDSEKARLEYWQEHIHPGDRAKVEQALEAHFQSGSKYDVTYRGYTDKGDYEWLHARGDTIFDASGKPLLMSGVLSNIQDKKQLEQELAEKSHFLNAILEKSLCGMYIFDLKKNINTYINPQYTEITGYDAEELQLMQKGGDMAQLFYQADLHRVLAHIEAVKSSPDNRGDAIQYRFRHKDGHWIWCYSRDSVYTYDDNGEPSEMLGTFFEISDLVEREERIKKLARDFYDTFEQAAVGIAHVGLDGSWLKANSKLCQILGYTREQLLKTNFQSITFQDDLESDLDQIDQLIRGEANHYSREKRYICANGQLIWTNLTVSIVRSEDGVNSHFISVVEDISERKAIEQALAESNSALERFAYSASHDLQEPLRKISAFSDSVAARLKGKLADSDAQYELSRIGDAARRMRDMINSLLQLSRSSRQKMVKEVVPLSELVAPVLDDLSEVIREHSAEIVLHDDARVWVDKIGFQQVLLNLIVNSIRYRRTGVPPKVEILCSPSFRETRIEICDNGKGFKDEFAEQIFEPFKRLVGKEISGSGMGLAICRQIIIGHGGTIHAHSRAINEKSSEESGAVFQITLPKTEDCS
ncbi:PAS/PAC sensor-containing signal transduction histidine kinase [Oleiphilus messinensis]|uniref:histidine kinase n=2 Tax=Oleiphilus messinensis TaxID=141451 RepID=A0A1Y0I4X8_9GAMM|nr:PAS/PAC sensor-containing signal transduction histidine kinase [Oleiphilus messinensis]